MGAHLRIALVGACIAALTVAAPPANAAFPGANGKIAFLKSGSSCLQLVNADATGQTEPGACMQLNPWISSDSAVISADGTRVLFAQYNGARDVYDRVNSKLDGTDPIVIGGFSDKFPLNEWSYDGEWISTVSETTCASCSGELHVALADGTGTDHYLWDVNIFQTGAWGSGGRIAITNSGGAGTNLFTTAPDGTASSVAYGPTVVGEPDWSPGADRITFDNGGIAVVNPDRSGLQNLTTIASDSRPKWSPDGQKILFSSKRDGNQEIYVMNPDGTGLANLTANPADDRNAVWSPDGKQIAFESNRDGDQDIYVMNRDGSGLVQATNNPGSDYLQDWQAIPITYPRPKGATPFKTYLVPAYKPCNAPDRTHGAPLAFGSCSSPQQTSSYLTVGTPDSNGLAPASRGSVQYTTVVGKSATPANEADVKIDVDILGVLNKSDRSPYTGQLSADAGLRITDKNNAQGPGGPGAATVQDGSFPVTVLCTSSSCAVSTTANALTPGAVLEGKRAIWQLGQVQVYDGGADGLASTMGDNTLFMDEGVFVP